MKKRRSPKVTNPDPILVRQKHSRDRWDVFDARSKLVKADLTRRDDASLLGEQWGTNGRAV